MTTTTETTNANENVCDVDNEAVEKMLSEIEDDLKNSTKKTFMRLMDENIQLLRDWLKTSQEIDFVIKLTPEQLKILEG